MTTWERLARIVDNPIIVKDGVVRMRSWRAPLIVTLYLGLLGLFGYGIFVYYALVAATSRVGSAQVGADVFVGLAFIQLALVSLFAPALAAGAISGERERQTLDVLLVSRVSALGIVWGKLVASVAFMLLLILAALPLFAAVFLFGGIDFEQFVVSQLLTVTTAVTLGAVSLFLSAAFRRTLPSTVMAYGVAFFYVVGTWVAGWLLTQILQARGGVGPAPPDLHPLMFINPAYAMYVVLTVPNGAAVAVGRLVALLLMASGHGQGAGPALEPWQAAVLVQLAAVGLSVVGSVQLVRGRRAPQPRLRVEEEPETAAELDLEG